MYNKLYKLNRDEQMSQKHKNGFSLIELSISIIIIGLLVAGISSGSKLIAQAEMRNIIAEFQDMGLKFNTFKTTYGAIPGDFQGAQVVFTGCAETQSNCDGNGNGYIDATNTVTDETAKALIHMMLSELVSKQVPFPLADLHDGAIFDYALDSPINGAKFFFGGGLFYNNLAGADSYNSYFPNSIAVYLGRYDGTAATYVAAALPPLTVFQIDQKMDDGSYSSSNAAGAVTGLLRAGTGYGVVGGCNTGTNYNITTTTDDCVLGFAVQ